MSDIRFAGAVCVLVFSIGATPSALAQANPYTGIVGVCVASSSDCSNSNSSGGLYAPDGVGARLGTWIHGLLTGEARSDGAADLNNQGVKRYQAQDYDGALALYRKAFAQNPDDPVIRENLMHTMVAISWRDWRAAPGDPAAMNRASGLYDEIERLLKSADPGSFQDYQWFLDTIAHDRQVIATERQRKRQAEENARALDEAGRRIAAITNNLAVDLNQPKAGAPGLSFGSPAAPSMPTAALTDSGEILASMTAYLHSAAWTPEKAQRVETLFNQLELPKSEQPTDSVTLRMRAWAPLDGRSADATLIAAAARGQGPGLYSSGFQTGSFSDCAVFALATAAGLPYGVVAARANELLSEAPWRGARLRSQPEQVFKEGGLMGGELIMLAEALGQAEVISQKNFEATLQAGRPVMVNLTNENGRSAHQVVLSKTFRHEGAVWYEMINSTQKGPSQRTFIRADEIAALLAEQGVAYRPDAGTTPQLLRNPN